MWLEVRLLRDQPNGAVVNRLDDSAIDQPSRKLADFPPDEGAATFTRRGARERNDPCPNQRGKNGAVGSRARDREQLRARGETLGACLAPVLGAVDRDLPGEDRPQPLAAPALGLDQRGRKRKEIHHLDPGRNDPDALILVCWTRHHKLIHDEYVFVRGSGATSRSLARGRQGAAAGGGRTAGSFIELGTATRVASARARRGPATFVRRGT